ncbi:VOC family protein [Carboxylicivirga sp. M1479]|uniref:VOC family protein n=1 Tax=Carboxylicivirga sp. M1479 TaxID=2594476 RepID=UPI00117898BD|nr:VOC family protein [Carboxylicivirga sp. M1479]TRX70238.1 VOC family protein [Carboxylicivirga sp. M1479]
MRKTIAGIQQVGVGVKDAKEAWAWYRKHFGMDINVFEDTAVAELMLPHTDGKTRERYAALALNMEGGGGFEIWQHTGIEPKVAAFELNLGDYGIFITKIKTTNIEQAYATHQKSGLDIQGELAVDPVGNKHYYLKDPYNNLFEIVQEDFCYKKQKSVTGGVFGCVIGVSDIESAFKVYRDILQYDEVVYDVTDTFDDYKCLASGGQKFRRVLLKHAQPRTGSFCKIYGPTQIELVQALDREPQKIFKDRIWGELGFIHLCFDIIGMDLLRKECKEKDFAFTVDSADSFDMGVAAGHFAYIEDPDGTLIEFVETHKLPIVEKLGWYMNLKGRNPKKGLPKWMINTLAFSRIKD